MTANSRSDVWTFRAAARPTRTHRFILVALIIAGVISILRFADWWFRADHVGLPVLYVMLTLAIWYGVARMVLMWINYLGIRRPERPVVSTERRVAIFTTSSPGEPLSMFDTTLAACAKISYPHTTYLLDDTRDPAFREVANKHGAVWIELVGYPGAKAGKVNEALKRTDEEIVLIMDPDHIPFPNFLDEVLGFFEDPRVGFVQVCQAYYNQYRSFTAKGAAEQTYGFYGPTMMGLHGYGASVAIGANCTFRRTALTSIGGHGIGLAEDLITAIRLHAQGWKSVYHPVIVSRGLVPEDFGSFCKQQLKWSRGVHEVLFAELPGLIRRLRFWQKLSYTAIGTYYLSGLMSFFYILLPFLFFWGGILPARMRFSEFILFGAPVVVIGILIYLFVQTWLCHPQMERGLHWRGMVLKFACWPVFLLGFLLSVVNIDIPYIPTAKKAVTGKLTPFVRPLLLHIGIFVFTLIYVLYRRWAVIPETELALTSEMTWGMIGFATLSVSMVIGGVIAAWQSARMQVEEPWKNIDLSSKTMNL
jgi:cellulose synthase (UDP-forming)